MFRFLRASTLFARIALSYGSVWLWTRLLTRRSRGGRWRRAHARNARRLFRGLVRLRGVYIKIGQVLSVLGSFLPGEYISELESLQDEVPPESFRSIRKAFLKDRGQPPEAIFAEFEPRPIAAASLAQVHRARLPGGEPVAVKILYPNIERIIAIDLKVIRLVFRVYSKLVPIVQSENILHQLRHVLQREADYEIEAANLERLRDNFQGETTILFPRVYREHSSRRILVLELMEGIKITAVDELRSAGINPTEVATLLVRSYYKQFLLDGLYHADPHPGNFLVQLGPRIVFLDFGAVEPVRDSLREGMIEVVWGMIMRDDEKFLAGVETMGFVAPDGDRELLLGAMRHYFTKLTTMKIEDFSDLDVERFLGPEEVRMIRGRLRELMRSIRYPEGYFYVERSLVLLFGVCATLDPKVNALQLGFPYAMEFILGRRQPSDPSSDTSSSG